LIRKVEALAAERKVTPAQLALAWVFARGNDIVPIPGSRRIERVKENLAALSLTLSPQDIALLDQVAPPGVASGDRYGAAMMATLEG
jgi:aryl-alcohol dehydrogenase-like predicted oxidoreductase